MNQFSGYIFLTLAVFFGIASNSYLKMTDGFTKIIPSIYCSILIVLCILCLAKAMMTIPVGFSYATYGGLTITAVTIFGIIKYNQMPNLYGIIGIFLIIVGVLIVNLLGNTNN
tara:strand:- start:82 stop:420 length:339 start_codon:yes stop_codon:yes gene_type:complete